MLNILLSRETVVEVLKELKKTDLLNSIKVGLAGSFARGTNKADSDIDVVLSYPLDIDDTAILIGVEEFITNKCDCKVDVLHLERLAEEDKKLDNLAISVGLLENDESAYKTIQKEVIWLD